MKSLHTLAIILGALALFSAGCASVQRGTPVAGTDVNVNLSRSDYTVLGPVKGTSSLQSYLFGLITVVDGDKVAVLGLKTFEDQYTFQQEPCFLVRMLGAATVEDRAYYKALAATPDADVVIPKAYVKQTSGIPLIASTKEVTFTGKAVKIKAD